MQSNVSRREFAALGAGLVAAAALPMPALALDVEEARALIDRVIADINAVIASSKSEAAMYADFEVLFGRYADVGYIAASALGPRGKKASAGQKKAFAAAYTRYVSLKYGKRFREMIGGQIEVKDAKPLKNFFEVVSVAKLQGQAPFEVRWHVFDKSGQTKFFNLIIEGVNMLASERAEIGALLDRQGGDIDRMIATLNG